MEDWPNCIVPGCPRKCCLALDSPKCFPHTKGNEHVKRWKIEARNAESVEGRLELSVALSPPAQDPR
jgi:hypothetical protein